MTYAPGDLKAVQRYAYNRTGQDWSSLGIVGDTSHNSSGGYHVGHDVLHALGTAPEDPGSDYSYTESQRDRNGLTDAASAFDLGGAFPRFREITLGIVAACQNGDPRTRDIREVIYTPDGQSVQRWDRLGVRNSGDDSHLSHTHLSFFRDAEGRRANADNFLGLLTELFEGKAPAPAPLLQGDNSVLQVFVPGKATIVLTDFATWHARLTWPELDSMQKAGMLRVPVSDAQMTRILVLPQPPLAPAGAVSPVQLAELKTATVAAVPTAAGMVDELVRRAKPVA